MTLRSRASRKCVPKQSLGTRRREMQTFDPSSLAKYGRLTMVARSVVEGFLSGVHKSPYKGFSVEFAEHRQYYPGDEIRHIDWRVLGKTDRYSIKEYDVHPNLQPTFLFTPTCPIPP